MTNFIKINNFNEAKYSFDIGKNISMDDLILANGEEILNIVETRKQLEQECAKQFENKEGLFWGVNNNIFSCYNPISGSKYDDATSLSRLSIFGIKDNRLITLHQINTHGYILQKNAKGIILEKFIKEKNIFKVVCFQAFFVNQLENYPSEV